MITNHCKLGFKNSFFFNIGGYSLHLKNEQGPKYKVEQEPGIISLFLSSLILCMGELSDDGKPINLHH